MGYFPKWMEESPATDVDRAALETVRKLGMVPVEVSLPDWPYGGLNTILFAEAAASFEELTLSQGGTTAQDAGLRRLAERIPAVALPLGGRLRPGRPPAAQGGGRDGAALRARSTCFSFPSLRDEMLTITNFTGHPSLTLQAGFVEVDQARSDWAPDPAHPLPTFSPTRRVPHGVTLIGRLFEEGTIGRVGVALERAFGVADERPPAF